MIGSGGFGNVYQYRDEMAVKDEFKVHMFHLLYYFILMSIYPSNH